MNKKHKKLISLLITLTFLMTLFIPFVGAASAATTYTTFSSPSRTAGATGAELGTTIINIDVLEGAVAPGKKHTAVFSLPVGYEINEVGLGLISGKKADGTAGTVSMAVYGDAGITVSGATPVAAGYNLNEFRLEVTAVDTLTDAKIQLSLPNVDIPTDAVTGDVPLSILSLSGQISTGSVTVAKITSGRGNIETSVVEPKNFNAGGTATGIEINVRETTANGFTGNNASSSGAKNVVTYLLPNGFTWDNVTLLDVSTGGAANAVFTALVDPSNDRKLHLEVNGANPSGSQRLRITADIVADDSVAKFGDVKATVTGHYGNVQNSELIVAKYADYGVKVSEGTTEEVVGGLLDQEIGEFFIEESAAGSLLNGRTLTLTLPKGAKWDTPPSVVLEKGSNPLGALTRISDDQTLRTTITGTTSASKIKLEKGKIRVAPDFTGDIVVEVGGTAGLSGKVTVAKAIAPVTATADAVKNVIVGEQAQAVSDFVVVEGDKEAIKKDAGDDLIITTPPGVYFYNTPEVTVVEGDLVIESVTRVSSNTRQLVVEVKSESSVPSSIKFSNVQLTFDRTVPTGEVFLRVDGEGIVETLDFSYDAVTTVAVAKVATPPEFNKPADQATVSTFTVGKNTYNVNGVEKAIDVAPFIKGDRVYVPVRFAGEAVGVSSDNVIWDGQRNAATLIRGDKVVQFTVGSNVMIVNGVSVTMDVAAENVNGRVVLPIGWVAKGLGITATWDGATQTATLN